MRDARANPEGFRVYVGRSPDRDADYIDVFAGGAYGRPTVHFRMTDHGLFADEIDPLEAVGRPTIEVSGLVGRGFLVALFDALTEYFSDKLPDPGAEAKVLREWLDHERGRVDRFLGHS